MTKEYFLQFDFWSQNINKFYFGIVSADLCEVELIDVCREVILANFPYICVDDLEIKVNALNNIVLDNAG